MFCGGQDSLVEFGVEMGWVVRVRAREIFNGSPLTARTR